MYKQDPVFVILGLLNNYQILYRVHAMIENRLDTSQPNRKQHKKDKKKNGASDLPLEQTTTPRYTHVIFQTIPQFKTSHDCSKIWRETRRALYIKLNSLLTSKKISSPQESETTCICQNPEVPSR